MNCRTICFELSQCLDGRLPSGRRTVVMQHVAECRSCATFWEELQQAQRLVLQLPRHAVGHDFRERLHERIRAGEGTPEAVFREPVPFALKVRYVLTGAAAAAAVLLVAALWRDRAGTGAGDHGTSGIGGSIAKVDNPVGHGTLVPRDHSQDPIVVAADPAPMISAAQPLTATLVAAEAARQIERKYGQVSRAIDRFDHGPTHEEGIVRQICTDAGEIRELGALLLDLRDSEQVAFRDADVDADLHVVVQSLAESRLHERSADTVRRVIAPTLRSANRLDRIARARMVTVTPTIDPTEELETLRRLTMTRPQVFPQLFVIMGTPEACEGFELPGLFAMRDACGMQFVAPRSQVEDGEARLNTIRILQNRLGQVQVEVRTTRTPAAVPVPGERTDKGH